MSYLRMTSALLAAGFAALGCSAPLAQAEGTAPVRAHANVRGIRLYYEMHGAGADVPLVLLPGGGSTIDVTYGQLLPWLAQKRKVIAIEEQNHGRSGHRDVPERFTDSADDVAALLGQLGVPQADVMGFSNGASIAMQVALRHRGLVRKLVFAASMTKKSGAPPQFWEMMSRSSFDDMPQALKDAQLKVDPDPGHLRDMYEKDSERMRNFVETSDEDVKSIDIPTLVLINDRDVPTLEHALELNQLFPHAKLIILPGGHGAFLGEGREPKSESRYPEASAILIEGFLNGWY